MLAEEGEDLLRGVVKRVRAISFLVGKVLKLMTGAGLYMLIRRRGNGLAPSSWAITNSIGVRRRQWFHCDVWQCTPPLILLGTECDLLRTLPQDELAELCELLTAVVDG